MTGGLLLDLALVLILIAYGISGYRHGLVSSVFSLLGFFMGALVGIWLLPSVLADLDAVTNDPRLRVLVLIMGVVLMGWIGQVLGSLLGAPIRRQLGQHTVRRTDSVLGAIVVVLAASLMIWFLGGSLRTAGNPAVARAVSESRVLRAVDSVMPEGTGQVFAGFRGFLSNQGFPQVFGDLVPEPIAPVEAPDPAIVPHVRQTHTEMRCALRGDKRAKEFQSRVPPAEQATPQCQCLIAHCGFVSAWKFSGLYDGKCLGQCDLFLRPLRIQC